MKVVTAFQLVLLSLLGKIIKMARCSGAVAEKSGKLAEKVRVSGKIDPIYAVILGGALICEVKLNVCEGGIIFPARQQPLSVL